MGILYVDEHWLAGRPVEETWPAAPLAEGRYYLGAAFTLVAALSLLAAPALIASLAIAGLLR